MDRDRNLLFGILAVQLRKLEPGQLIDVAGAWAADTSRGLPERVVEANMMAASDRELIEALVDQAIGVHDGDTASTLETFGGSAEISRSFCGSIAVTVEGEVVSSTPTRSLHLEVKKELSTIDAVEETAGRYTNPREYSRGGLGRILLVHDQYLGRHVALKELLPPTQGSQGDFKDSPVRQAMPLVARFLQEARITGQLEHPSIIPVYELGRRKDGSVYYTMKLVRGKTLAAAISDGDTIGKRLELLPHFVDLCQAIAYAHSRGVIHRDIKPANVMVGEFGETVVIDWGLAKAVDTEDIHAVELEKTLQAMRLGEEADLAQTHYGEILGTPVYMSPEQARGRINEIDERSDIYSLGAVLFEILIGKPPFAGQTLQEILTNVVDGNLDHDYDEETEIPQELRAICRKAMSVEPRRRYQSALDLAGDIQNFLSGGLVGAHSYKLSDHFWRFVRQNKAVLSTLGAAAVVLLIFGVASLVRVGLEKDAADYSFYRASLGLAEQNIESSRVEVALNLLFACPSRFRGWEWGHLVARANMDLAAFEVPSDPYWITFHPEGTKVYFGSNDQTVGLLDLKTGEVIVKKIEGGWSRGAVFCEDGSVRIFGVEIRPSEPVIAREWDFETGEEIKNTTTVNATYNRVLDGSTTQADFSEDGRYVALTGENHAVRVWNLDSGEAVLTVIQENLYIRVDFNSLRGLLATVDKKRLVVWHIESGEVLWQTPVIDGPREYSDVLFLGNGSRLCGLTSTGQLEIWEIGGSHPVFVQERVGGWNTWEMKTSRDGKYIVFPPDSDTSLLWEVGENGMTQLATVVGDSPSLSPDSSVIATVTRQENAPGRHVNQPVTIRIWAAERSNTETSLPKTGRMVAGTAISSDGNLVATGSEEDPDVRVWETSTGRLVATLHGPSHDQMARALCFNPKGDHIVTRSWGSDSGETVIWTLPSGDPHTVLLEEGWVDRAAFNAVGDRLATVEWRENGARIWDPDSAELIQTIQSKQAFTGVSFFPSGEFLALSDAHGSAFVWGIADERLRPLSITADAGRSTANERSVTVDRKGQRVAVSNVGADWDTVVWDVFSGKEITRFRRGEFGLSRGVALGPFGRRLVANGESNSMIVYDVDTGHELLRLRGLTTSPSSTVFTLDGLEIVAVDFEGHVRKWSAFPWWDDGFAGGDSVPMKERVELYKREYWKTKLGADHPIFGGTRTAEPGAVDSDEFQKQK